jgi:hypothetical protein
MFRQNHNNSMNLNFVFGTQVHFAGAEEARKLLSREDDYTRILTRFDLQAKIKTRESVQVRHYLDNAQRYVAPWLQPEIAYLQQRIAETAEKIVQAGLIFDLPNRIYLVKSAMHEEGGANGFTRADCIVLNQHSLSGHLFEHELFHIISRFNPGKIERAYGIIGFKRCNEVNIPTEIIDRKISNPDAPFNNYYITVTYDGRPVEAIMFLYAAKDYEGGSFFKYVNKGLMLVEGADDNKKAVMHNGLPKIIKYEEAADLVKQIGRNTSYNIHPEEITADHFIMALNKETGLPDQHLVDNLVDVLR